VVPAAVVQWLAWMRLMVAPAHLEIRLPTSSRTAGVNAGLESPPRANMNAVRAREWRTAISAGRFDRGQAGATVRWEWKEARIG
jgi:hypothetical protein